MTDYADEIRTLNESHAAAVRHHPDRFRRPVAAGKKRTEYRDRTKYWRVRLEDRHFDVVKFRNGYATDAPTMTVEVQGIRVERDGRRSKYAIRLGRILEIKRWRP